jgi:hypothetical protein
MHEELRERCNNIGESINDFVKAAIEFALYESVDFDFGWPDSSVDDMNSNKTKNDSNEPKPTVVFID